MILLGRLLVGVLLLLFGRRLFWFFVAAIGFAAGMTVATQVLQIQQEGVAILIGLVFGLVGALLATFLQSLAIGVAGFVGGAYILGAVAAALNLGQGQALWIVYLVGGILGVILMAQFFDIAVIVLSSLAGASLVVEALGMSRPAGILAIVVLFIFGVVAQMDRKRLRRS
ncbi:MAG: hypothetical protein AB1846_04815 [Chloroflexota bacterium]